MAEADWADLGSGALDTAAVGRGVTSAFILPHAACGTFCYGFKSLLASSGFAGKYVNLANFNPEAANKGGSIRGLMKRFTAYAPYAPMMGFLMGADPSTAVGYFIGLTQATSYQIALLKGVPGSGLDPASLTVLRKSTLSYTQVGDAAANWFQLRLDVIVNPHGEVILNCFANNPVATSPSAPSWTAITGMDAYVDDTLGVLTGTIPKVGPFYPCFGHYTANALNAVSLFDHIEVYRQTNP